MADTAQGRQLTEQHRVEQQQVRAQFLVEFAALWALLDTARLDDTSPGWVAAVLRTIRVFRVRSAQVATGYYLEFQAVEAPSTPAPRPQLVVSRRDLVTPPTPRPRPSSAPSPSPSSRQAAARQAPRPAASSRSTTSSRTPQPSSAPRPARQPQRGSDGRLSPADARPPAAVVRPEPPTPRVEPRPEVRLDLDESAFNQPDIRRTQIDIPDIDWGPSDRAAKVSLEVTGPVGQKSKIGRGKPAQTARDESFVEAAGAASRQVLTGGRQSLLTLLGDDPQAIGWARVTDGDPCAFCAMLSGRGIVYKTEASAGFKAHDACACTAEPAYSRSAPLPGRGDEFRRMWNDNIRGRYSGQDAINAWRRLYEQQQRDQRRGNVA